MPNINQKVEPIRPGSLPDLRRGVNETIDMVNWLMRMRVNNGTISEGEGGPIFNTGGGLAAVSAQPWLTDPDGNAASWQLATFIDTNTGNFFDGWVWAGGTKNVRPVPWWDDTNGHQAGWLIGAQGEVWGTGSYPSGTANYQQVKFAQPTSDASPTTFTGSLTVSPITPPTSGAPLFLKAPPAAIGTDPSVAPITQIWMPSLSGPLSPGPSINFTWQITYDGTVIFNVSGSANFNNPKIYVPLSKTGWQYDPAGLTGYTKGENSWIYLYTGAISANTNPPIIQTFIYTTSNGATVEATSFGVTLYTG